jgi:2OG-Fe(II) oxygenase superfamily
VLISLRIQIWKIAIVDDEDWTDARIVWITAIPQSIVSANGKHLLDRHASRCRQTVVTKKAIGMGRKSKPSKSEPQEDIIFPSDLLRANPPSSKAAHQHPETLLQGFIWVLRNFLTQQECQAWINHVESDACKLEYLQQRGTRYLAARECFRFHREDATMSHRLFERLKATQVLESLPQFPGEEPVTFNPSLRLYKYDKGMSFAKHVDDSNVVAGIGVTRMTVLIYLSNCQGGATRFEQDTAFEPASGAILLHVHGDLCLEHQADPVVSGTKWVLRTDLVYTKNA